MPADTQPDRPSASSTPAPAAAALPLVDRERSNPHLQLLVHLIVPIFGSLFFHLGLAAILAVTTWKVLIEPREQDEYAVGIVDGTNTGQGGGFEWEGRSTLTMIEPDKLPELDSLRFSDASDLSDLGTPQPNQTAGAADGGGFGIGDSGRSGVLGIGSGAGEGGGGGFGSGFGAGTSIGTAGVWDLSARGNDFAYVVDYSGSIIVAEEDLRRELKRSIGSLRPTQSFSVFVFYSTGDRQRERFRTEGFAPKLQPASANRKRDFFAWIDSKKPRGSTDPLPAMRRALALGPDVVFFFSDGYFEDGVVRSIADANKGRTVIHCLVFDELLLQDTSDLPRLTDGARRLKQIAEQSGGTVKIVTGADLGR